MVTPRFRPRPLEKTGKQINIKISHELHVKIQEAADSMNITRYDLIIQAIDFAIDHMQVR